MPDTTVWHTPQGEPLTCYEKLNVLNQNIDEVAATLQDVMEEAVLIGCDADQMRNVLHNLVKGLRDPYQKKTDRS
ncbi:MAG: hypothetical protein GDA50_01455 [Alphaproteobacteria bacterium GM202ARS2]|nr:hypothetical protein [Alphaproteobacteria bacterium GM202ARS2]